MLSEGSLIDESGAKVQALIVIDFAMLQAWRSPAGNCCVIENSTGLVVNGA